MARPRRDGGSGGDGKAAETGESRRSGSRTWRAGTWPGRGCDVTAFASASGHPSHSCHALSQDRQLRRCAAPRARGDPLAQPAFVGLDRPAALCTTRGRARAPTHIRTRPRRSRYTARRPLRREVLGQVLVRCCCALTSERRSTALVTSRYACHQARWPCRTAAMRQPCAAARCWASVGFATDASNTARRTQYKRATADGLSSPATATCTSLHYSPLPVSSSTGHDSGRSALTGPAPTHLQHNHNG